MFYATETKRAAVGPVRANFASVRFLSRAYVIGLSMIALVGVALLSLGQWNKLAKQNEAETAARVLMPAIRFVEVLALERGVYNQVLVSKETGLDQARELVADRVAATDLVFQETLQELAALSPAASAGILQNVLAARRIVRSARAEADSKWKYPDKVAPDISRKVVAKFVEARGSIEKGLDEATRLITDNNSDLGLMIEISRVSNDLREMAGQRSTLLSRYAGTLQRFDVAEW